MKRNKSLLVLLCLSALSMSCSTARLETNNHYYYTTEYIQEKDLYDSAEWALAIVLEAAKETK